jgi:peptidoglycan/xylan/chitin deacetylase (PgdA/CDA1 family)
MATGRPIDDRVLAAFLSWLHEAGLPGGAPAGTTVRTVRQVMGAPPPPPLPPSQTVVSLTFDDGDATQLLVEPLLRAHGLPGTFFIVTGRLDAGNPANMSWADVLRLAREGNEIGGHTVSHVDLTDPRLPEAVKTQEVCGNRSRLQQMGLDPVSFAYPYGTSDPAVEALVRSCGYRTARTGGGADPDSATPAETLPPADPFATRALHTPPSGPWTSAALERAVTAAAQNGGGWVQVPFHRICVPTDAQFAACMSGDAPIERGAFDSFLGWLQHSAPRGTTVRTVGDVIRSAG